MWACLLQQEKNKRRKASFQLCWRVSGLHGNSHLLTINNPLSDIERCLSTGEGNAIASLEHFNNFFPTSKEGMKADVVSRYRSG